MESFNWSFSVQEKSHNVPTIGEAISALEKAKNAAGCRSIYVKGLRAYLQLFARGREHIPISSVTVDDVDRWFEDRAEKPVTRASNIGRIGSLFGYAYRRGWISDNPCRRLERVRLDAKPPRILSPTQVRTMLYWVADNRPNALAWFVLGAYAGVRPAEGYRLTWDDIDLDAGILTINSSVSKVRHRRIVHLQPIAVRWLRRALQMDSRLPISRTTVARVRREARRPLGMGKWDQDILRHTAASHLLALHQDAGKVARELGNSAGVLLRHYVELVTRKQACYYWEQEDQQTTAEKQAA